MALSKICSPEYLAIQKNYELLVAIMKAEIGGFCDALFAEGFISPDVRDYTRIDSKSCADKARKLLDTLIDRIENSPAKFQGFVDILKLKSPFTDDIVGALLETYSKSNQEVMDKMLETSEESVFSPSFANTENAFPYLDLSGLDISEKSTLEAKLRSDTRDIIMKFARFTVNTRKSMTERNEPIEEVIDTVLSLGVFVEDIGVRLLEKEDKEKIQAATTIARVFTILRSYFSFFNYHVIEHLIECHGSIDDSRRMEEYASALEAFCKRSVFEIPTNVFAAACAKGTVIALKCTDDTMSLAGVQVMQEKTAKILGLQTHTLQLCSIKKGCVELCFSAPSVADYILPLSRFQLSAFHNMAVTTVSFGDQVKVETATQQSKEAVEAISRNSDLKKIRLSRRLVQACQQGQLHEVITLIQQGADLEHCFKGGLTPLLAACLQGHMEIVKQLIAHGASVNHRNKDGTSPLLIASQRGHTNIAELLIERGAVMNYFGKSHFKITPLLAACDRGHIDTVKLLINKGASLNDADENGRSPLLVACVRGHKEIACLLVSLGADIHQGDKYGKSPCMAALEGNYSELANFLMGCGANMSSKSVDDSHLVTMRKEDIPGSHQLISNALRTVHPLRRLQVQKTESKNFPSTLSSTSLSDASTVSQQSRAIKMPVTDTAMDSFRRRFQSHQRPPVRSSGGDSAYCSVESTFSPSRPESRVINSIESISPLCTGSKKLAHILQHGVMSPTLAECSYTFSGNTLDCLVTSIFSFKCSPCSRRSQQGKLRSIQPSEKTGSADSKFEGKQMKRISQPF